MADGRHLEFRFFSIISASINIFAPDLVERWKINTLRRPIVQKSGFRKSKMADGRHLGFRFWAIISASINIFCTKIGTEWWQSATQGDRLLRIKPAAILNFKTNYYNSVVDWDICLKFRKMVDSVSKKSAVCILLKQQILYRKNCIQCILKLYKSPL